MNTDEQRPRQDLVEVHSDSELPSWIGMIDDDDGELTSQNVREWLREHWAEDIERRMARRNDANFWNAVGFEEVESEEFAGTGIHLWRMREALPE